ncbi:MAG: hypothetical protein E7Z73_05880 [Methanobrevibacter millerae]|uniref:Uncharacterized protein n=1 Tax=Methanobrevibacter millerae TaxID=230361 RepID=A0A8T3VM27_9EURY|nr:hypothetical protein [Methanobrevibacter millerae]MBE6505254.1 hypothetical protein [Methanobrevibacter millerae]
MADIELLTYENYYENQEYYRDMYLFIGSNTQLQAVKECVENAGLCLALNHAVAIETYKLNAIEEIKRIINIIGKKHDIEDVPIPFDAEKLPYIEPMDYETQIYNVIKEDIENILSIEKNNKINMEKYFCCSDQDANKNSKSK